MVNKQDKANVVTMDTIYNTIKGFKDNGGIVSASELENKATINVRGKETLLKEEEGESFFNSVYDTMKEFEDLKFSESLIFNASLKVQN